MSTVEDLQKKDSTLKKCFDRVEKLIIRENCVGEFFIKIGSLDHKHQETKTGLSFNQWSSRAKEDRTSLGRTTSGYH